MVVEAQPAQWRQETHSLIRSETGSLPGPHLLAANMNAWDQVVAKELRKPGLLHDSDVGGIDRVLPEINGNKKLHPDDL